MSKDTLHQRLVETTARQLAAAALAPLEEERDRLRRRSEIVDNRLAAIRKLNEDLRARVKQLYREADDPEACTPEARERLLGHADGVQEAQRVIGQFTDVLP